MAWSKVNSCKITGTGNSVTTSASDTRTSTLITVTLNWLVGTSPTFSDSKSNTWTFTSAENANLFIHKMAYCLDPMTDANHTFTFAGSGFTQFPMVLALALKDTGTSRALDVGKISQFRQADVATTIQPGSLTSSDVNGVFIDGANTNGTDPTINSNFTKEESYAYSVGNNCGGGIAWKTSASTATENPTWSWSTNSQNESAATQMIFLYSGAAASSSLMRQSKLDGLGAGGPFFSNPLGG